ncbi:putative transcription factor IBH1-like, bHLH domain-containing protein [Helianthus annuus]|nr:putative transcription factor IBH1-like, bHLH domain-containing protein [Helianthus annuus]
MTSSTTVPNPITNNENRSRDSSKRRKRKKFQMQNNNNNRNCNNNDQISGTGTGTVTPWKSEVQRQIYSSKLLQAVRHVRQSSITGTVKSPRRGRAVREAADRILAATGKGRTRWSRAILTNKLKLKFLKSNRRQRGLVATVTGNSRLKKPRVSILRLKTKNLPAVQRKSRVLGGLVPGCRKQPFPVVLEEAIDYIPALEMQVKAMAELVQLLSGAGSSSGSGNLAQLGFSRPPPNL